MNRTRIKGIVLSIIGSIGAIGGSVILPIAMHSKKKVSFIEYENNNPYKVSFKIGTGIYNLNLIYDYEIDDYNNKLSNIDIESIKTKLDDYVDESKKNNKYQISEWYYSQFIKNTQEHYKKILNESNSRYEQLESEYNKAKDDYLNYKGDVSSPDYQNKKIIYESAKLSLEAHNEVERPNIEEYKELVDSYKLFYILRILGITLIPLFSIILFIGIFLILSKKDNKNKPKIVTNKLENNEER